MKKLAILLCAPALLTLNACGGANETNSSEVAEDFAARINGSGPTAASVPPTASLPEPASAPTIAPPRPSAAPGPFAPGTATDPESAICNANIMGPFLNTPADDATRAAIMEMATEASEVRFLLPGSDVRADPTNPRLNLMLDTTGVIRDARCG